MFVATQTHSYYKYEYNIDPKHVPKYKTHLSPCVSAGLDRENATPARGYNIAIAQVLIEEDSQTRVYLSLAESRSRLFLAGFYSNIKVKGNSLFSNLQFVPTCIYI